MPIDELAGGFLRILARLIGYFIIEIILELLIRGPGYILLKFISGNTRKQVEPDGIPVLLVGILFWVVAFGFFN